MPDPLSRAEQRRSSSICLIAICLVFTVKAGLTLLWSDSTNQASSDNSLKQAQTKLDRPEPQGRVVQSVSMRDHHGIRQKNQLEPDLKRLQHYAPPQWRKNAVAVKNAKGSPEIAIVIDDIGLKKANSKAVMKLDGPLTLAFLPYADKLEEQAKFAQEQGHELLVHMPMQPKSRDINPGPNVLRADLKAEELEQRLAKSLAAFDGYVGINNHMGSRFTGDRKGMDILMRKLADRGLLYLDSLTTPDSVGASVAADYNVPYAARNVFLDHVPEPSSIRTALRQVERIAREEGHAIAIGHPRDATIAVLKQWMPKARERGFQFVPVSALTQREGDNAHISKKQALR